MVEWTAPSVNSDDGEVSIDTDTCYPKPGSNFTIGATKVVCEARNVDLEEENMCHLYVNVFGMFMCFNIILFIYFLIEIRKVTIIRTPCLLYRRQNPSFGRSLIQVSISL